MNDAPPPARAAIGRKGMALSAISSSGRAAPIPGAAAASREVGRLPPFDAPPGPLPELTAEWWQWAVSIPEGQNPQTDGTGQDCMVGQRGSLWFLAGVFGGGTATRACSVPEGATIFFPVRNSVFFNTPDCGQGGQNFTVRELRRMVKPAIDNVQGLSVKVDNANIKKDLLQRVQSVSFAAAFPADNIYGPDACATGQPLPAGIYSPSVDDGYYTSIPPLKPGPHTLQFYAQSGSFIQDVTYNLTVVPVSAK